MESNSSHLVFFVWLVFTFAQLCYKQQVCLPDFSNISTPTLPQKPYKSPEIWAKSETQFYFSQPLLKEARSLWCTHTSLNISIKNVTFHSGVNDAQELSVKCVLKVQCVYSPGKETEKKQTQGFPCACSTTVLTVSPLVSEESEQIVSLWKAVR